MTSKICPKCNQIADYDPYFKAYFCKECGWMEDVSVRKKIVRLRKPPRPIQARECARLALSYK